MRVLLLQDDKDVTDKLTFVIESGFGAVVQTCKDLDKALAILSGGPDGKIDLLILDSTNGLKIDLADLAIKLVDVAVIQIVDSITAAKEAAEEKAKAASPGVVPGGSSGFKIVKIDRAEISEKLPAAINEMLDRGQIHEKGAPESRCRVRTHLLLSVSPLKGDIYIRLSEKKFVKLFQNGDVFDRADLEKYAEKKGVEYLYIRKEDCGLFAAKYREDLEKLLKLPQINTDQAIQSAESVNEAVQSLARTVGFTAEVQELVKTQIKVTMKAIANSPKLSDLFAKLKSMEGKYLSTHSHLTAYLACAIASQLKWGSEQTFTKLNLACFLHDITLSNHELAAETSWKKVESSVAKYTAEEIRAYHSHPKEAARHVAGFSEVPPDVDTILAQHHELPDASGFPMGLSHSRIAPLAAIFIVSHDMAQFVMASPDGFDLKRFLNQYGDKYIGSQFKKIVQALQTMQEFKEVSAGSSSGSPGSDSAAA